MLLFAQAFAASGLGRLAAVLIGVVAIVMVVNVAIGEQIPPKVKQIAVIVLVAAFAILAIWFLLSLF